MIIVPVAQQVSPAIAKGISRPGISAIQPSPLGGETPKNGTTEYFYTFNW